MYNKKGDFLMQKEIIAYENSEFINEWIKPFRAGKNDQNLLGKFPFMGNDFQQQNIIQINHINMIYNKAAGQFLINANNLIKASIYFAVRKSIPATWLNDRDQFLKPNDLWKDDFEFQNDCLAYTLFSNNIQSDFGTNHWIPFSENEVNAQSRFESNFMVEFINGKIKLKNEANLFGANKNTTLKREFSEDAKDVFDAGRELWKYYHIHTNVNVNASFYDIRAYFQGRNDKGRMNSKSDDEKYIELIAELRNKLNFLADIIKPKIYEYEFLKE